MQSIPNSHITSFLEYYIDPENEICGAVLINGEWGVGKTFFLKNFFLEKKLYKREMFNTNQSKTNEITKTISYSYVSLNGISHKDEIDSILIKSMIPDNYVGKIEKTYGAVSQIFKFFNKGNLNDIKINQFINPHSADIIVFDDLERCKIPIDESLGYINHLTEQEKKKIIIICNEEKIRPDTPYSKIKEKTIFKTFHFQDQFDKIIEIFLNSSNSNEFKEFTKSNRDSLLKILKLLSPKNYRAIQYVLQEIEHLYTTIDQKYKKNPIAMIDAIEIVIYLSFERRIGNILDSDISSWNTLKISTLSHALMNSMNTSLKNDNKTVSVTRDINRVKNILTKYPPINTFTPELFSDETLKKIISEGNIDSYAINYDIGSSKYFKEPPPPPEWRIVSCGTQYNDDEFYEAFNKMEEKYSSKQYVIPEEILHVLGNRIWLSKIGILKLTIEDVISNGMEYISDLASRKILPPLKRMNLRTTLPEYSHGGIVYMGYDTCEFKKIYKFLQDQRLISYKNSLKDRSDNLFAILNDNPQQFTDMICIKGNNPGEYCDAPVLLFIEAEKFASGLLSQTPENLYNILTALTIRYSANSENILEEEKSWITEVRRISFDKSKLISNFSHYRISHYFSLTVDTVIF